MLTLDLKSRFRNKAFLLSFIGAIVLLIQQLGFKNIIPSNYVDVVNSILTILAMVGIVVDTSTSGISDKVIVAATVQTQNVAQGVQTEASTTSINGEVQAASQESETIPIEVTNSETVPTDDIEELKATNTKLQATIDSIQASITPIV